MGMQQKRDIRKGMSIQDDDDNPDGMFTRSEFIEALIRFSIILKRKDQSTADSLENVLARVSRSRPREA